jgi:hypothetical protein
VVISRKLYQPWEPRYFAMIRERMFATVAALYGPSREAIVTLRDRYGADYLLVPRSLDERPTPVMAPFTRRMRELQREVDAPAVGQLPASCETWQSKRLVVYDLACVARAGSG